MSQRGVFGLTRPAALAIIDRICHVVREWRLHFDEAGIPGKDIDRVATAIQFGTRVTSEALRSRGARKIRRKVARVTHPC